MMIGVVDIGGTSIKYGVLNEKGELLFHASVPTEAEKGGAAVIRKVCGLGDELKERFPIEGMAISSAGQIDNHKGEVVFATDNIPGYTGMDITGTVRRHTGLPVAVENDVNCMALGEHWKGAARGLRDFVCLTIGTGIGGALFLDGKLYTGARFSAGEIGHLCLYPGGKPCTCGNRGCYEQYASSTALSRLAAETFGPDTGLREFFGQVRSGDGQATALFNRWVDDLTTGLQSLVHIFNPEAIIIGGGISEQGDLLTGAIRESLDGKIMPNHRRSLEVRAAEQGNKANLLGAAAHFWAGRESGGES
ncbi:ROK family protein [Bhargavaea ullalensis]